MNGISVRVRREFLDRDACLSEARRILSEGHIRNMNEIQLAREIRFHALAYYFCERTGWFSNMKAHADPIDIDDGGDTFFRRVIYTATRKIGVKKR